MNHINPVELFGEELQSIQNPARYLGKDYGEIVKEHADITFVIAFPDLYEIAMSNQAVRIIYNGLNDRSGVRCERCFAPAEDFEEFLKIKKTSLYTLETGIPLAQTDLIGFSLGYELGLSAVLSMLDCSFIPLLKEDRTENDPIVFAGGCGVTNPAPLGIFFDAIFIGEAEDELFDLVEKMGVMKKKGASRTELLSFFSAHPAVWVPGKKAVRAISTDFGKKNSPISYFPVASLKPVQDHGVVEIMRGCPNGCRFCHAGVYYRPQRMKNPSLIKEEVFNLVHKAGYREVSLTSLSSADYSGVGALLDTLNERWDSKRISFQLPSLRVNSLTLPILESLSKVRKSGLTFAVETPVETWQLAVNKEVYADRLIEIILEAKKRGWNKAKFYFMVGLPVENLPTPDGKKISEEEAIVEFLLKIQARTKIQCNVNVGTFIPKPHTAYQWVPQLTMEESRRKLFFIRDNLPRGKFKVSTHNEFVSFIEGIITRGDEKAGLLWLEAWKKGCRLDAWEDHVKRELWEETIKEASWNVEKEVCRERALDEKLPWDDVSMGAGKAFYKKEWQQSLNMMLTPQCNSFCDHPCGICHGDSKVRKFEEKESLSIEKSFKDKKMDEKKEIQQDCNIPVLWRVLFSFSKKNGGEYLPHLALVETFHKAFLRADLPILYTAGFNPQPRFELASSLSLGIHTECEIASCLLRSGDINSSEFVEKMNKSLPSSLSVEKAFIFPVSNKKKRESLASLLWGSRYEYDFYTLGEDEVSSFLARDESIELLDEVSYEIKKNKVYIDLPFKKDRKLRNSIADFFERPVYECVRITKKETLATTNPTKENGRPISYFDLYDKIAEKHKKLIKTDSE